jgi:3-polyprenyl-4-hydroxybenzoate decarboxylase
VLKPSVLRERADMLYKQADVGAPIASGSFKHARHADCAMLGAHDERDRHRA